MINLKEILEENNKFRKTIDKKHSTHMRDLILRNWWVEQMQTEINKIEEKVKDFDLSLAYCDNIDSVFLLSDDVFKDYKNQTTIIKP